MRSVYTLRKPVFLVLLWSGTAVSLISCAPGSSRVRSNDASGVRVLTPNDFVVTPAEPDTHSANTDGDPQSNEVEEVVGPGLAERDVQAPSAGDSNPQDLYGSIDEVLSEQDAISQLEAIRAIGEPLTVSGLVGQINGRPIYVEQVFRPIADQIRIIGLKSNTMREFIQLSYPLILTELITVVDSELLLTEAERNLTEQERRGLLYWLSAEREKQVRSAGGTRAGLENKLLSEGGITIEEHMDVLRKQVLGSEHLRKEIGPRIVVSWRDIERYYESHPEEFNSHETVELRIIKVNEANRNRIPLIQQALDEGEPFENVARQYSDLLASGGGLLRENPVAQATNIPEVNAVVSQLKEHEFTGPIETAGGTYWVYMENHNAPRSVSLYDAQRDIQKKLFDQMARQEEINYKLKLRQRADYDENDVEYMTTALLAVATSRWGPRE